MTASSKTTRNACKCCTPLGACMAFKGVESTVTLLHGSQGCSTYIRRYCISHFREPLDIASTSFSEENAVFGGGDKLKKALLNIISGYKPKLIGIASTCLSETIGDDISLFIHEFINENSDRELPYLVQVSTPSYNGTHVKGYYSTVKEIIKQLSVDVSKNTNRHYVNIFPCFLCPEDLRDIKANMKDFNLSYLLLPDYSETLDGGSWDKYQKIPQGGALIEQIKVSPFSKASIEIGTLMDDNDSAAVFLRENYNISHYRIPVPMGIENSDRYFSLLEKLSGISVPDKYLKERARLLDAMADGHKYLFGKKVVLYGDEDLVFSLLNFVLESGMDPVLCTTGSVSAVFKKAVLNLVRDKKGSDAVVNVYDDFDFNDIEEKLSSTGKVDLLIGNSKGYKISKKMDIPLLRTGFPVHDRFGAQRLNITGYKGTLRLLDQIINLIIEVEQEKSGVGYTYY